MLALPPFSDCRCTQLTWISALLEMSHCAVSVLMFCYTISIQAFSSQQSYRSKWFQCTTTWFKFFSEIWIKPPSWAILFSRTPTEQVVSTAELPCFSNGLCLHVLHMFGQQERTLLESTNSHCAQESSLRVNVERRQCWCCLRALFKNKTKQLGKLCCECTRRRNIWGMHKDEWFLLRDCVPSSDLS